MKASEVLDKAADIIIRDGWHQGSYFKVNREDTDEEDAARAKVAPCCQDGAQMRAAYGTAWARSDIVYPEGAKHARQRASYYMNQYVKRVHDAYSPIEWNDRSSTKRAHVVAALRGAAEDARRLGE